jgi:hypothetical protein
VITDRYLAIKNIWVSVCVFVNVGLGLDHIFGLGTVQGRKILI